MKPGAYLRLRREAAGLSLDDVALALETAPPVSARSRAEWIGTVEAGDAPLTIGVALALQRIVTFDWDLLVALAGVEAGLGAYVPAFCRVCACSEWDPCTLSAGDTCGWAKPDLCTRCAPEQPQAAAA